MANEINVPDAEASDLVRYSAKETPAESAQILQRSSKLSMKPEEYNEVKETFDVEEDIKERVPAVVSQPLKNFMGKDPWTANMIEPEVGKWETFTRMARHSWYNLTEKGDLETEISDLNYEDRVSENGLDQDRLDYLDGLYDIRDEEQGQFKLEGGEQIPGQVAGVVNDMYQAVTDNKSIIAASTAVGAFTPVPFGTLAGLGYGITTALVKDAYYRTADATYGELRRMKDEKGQPLKISRDQRDNISMGVGIAAGALEALTGKVLTKGLGRLLKPKTAILEIIKRPGLKAAMDILGHATKSAVTSGGEEVSAEVVSILGENFAQSDQSSAGFLSAMQKTTDQIINDPATRKRLGMTAITGAAAGGSIATVTGAIGWRSIKKSYEENNISLEAKQGRVKVVENAVKVLENQDNFARMAEHINGTDLKSLSPEQLAQLRKDVFADTGVKGNMAFTQADLALMEESDPELVAKIRSLDVTEGTENNLEAPVLIAPDQFLGLVEDAPTVSEYARLNPEALNPLESKAMLARLDEAETRRQAIFESLGAEGKLTVEQTAELLDIDDEINAAVDETTEEAYLNSPTFTEGTESVISDAEVERFNKAQFKAREHVLNEIKDKFETKEQAIEDRVVKANDTINQAAQLRENKKNLEVIERFKNSEGVEQSFHSAKGFGTFAIDPKYISEDIRETLITDPVLKSRKTFVEGGVGLEESAAMLGLNNGDELINILANTPTRKQMLEVRQEQATKLRQQVREVRSKDKNARLETAFGALNDAHLAEMKFLKSKQWGNTKLGFRKIALPIPKIADLNFKAAKVIKGTKVIALSPRQFKTAEATHQRAAHGFILNNKVEAAFQAKEQAMLNVELQKESLQALNKIESSKKFIKKLTSKNGLKNIKSKVLKAEMTNILELFDLNPSSNKTASARQGYVKHLKTLNEQGISQVIPESLNDIRARGQDLTVDQYLKITDRLRSLSHQSKLMNRLLVKNEKRAALGKLQTQEAVVVDALEDLESHPTYDSERNVGKTTNPNSKYAISGVADGFNLVSSMLSNLKNIVTELDQERLGGKHYENIVQPMVNAETNKRAKTAAVVEQVKKIANAYNEKDFKAAFNTFIDIKEFQGFNELGNGRMVKSDLWMLFSYLGDPQAKERIGNFKHNQTGELMTVETVQKILDVHLDEKDAKLAQNFVNIFKSFEGESRDLHFNSTGVEPNMVKGVPVTHRGKVYDGGYVPNNYLNISQTDKIERFLDVLGNREQAVFGDGESGKLYSKLRAAEQTEQGRLMDRTGSQKPLDTNFMNFLHSYEEHIHDVSYREAGSDVLNLLKNPVYSKAISDTVGVRKYQTMVAGIIETVGDGGNDAGNPYSRHRQAANSIYKYLEQGYNIKTLGFKATSVLMQPLSFGAATLRMGPKGGKYILQSLGNVIANLHNYDKNIFNIAAEKNPDLLTGRDSIDDTLVKSTYDFIPKTNKALKNPKANKAFNLLKLGRDKIKEASMAGLTKFDLHIKAVGTMAAYSEFIAGDAPNFDMKKLDTMTDEQVETAARKYVKQIADLALTTSADIDKSGIEKINEMRIFTRFYTDLRAQLNTGSSQIRKIRNQAIEGKANYQDGNYTETLSNLKAGSIDASALFIVYSLSKLYADTLYDQETPLEELSEVTDLESLGSFIGAATDYTLKAPVQGLIGSVPALRDIQFAYNSKSRNKKVNLPINQVFSDVTVGLTGLADLLEGDDLSTKQQKAMLSTLSYIGGGIPVNGPFEIKELIQDSEVYNDVTGYVGRELERLGVAINVFSDKHENNPEAQEVIEGLKQIQKEMIPPKSQEINNIIPEDTLEVLKLNKWNDQDPETGAAGVYQFTEERWTQIAEAEPDLGLTDNGRVSQDPAQQEKAMEWDNKNNAENLLAYGAEVNNRNLYGAHKFGVDDYVAILLSDKGDKLQDVVQNKDLFKGFNTIKEVKQYVNKQIPVDSKIN